MNDSVDKNNPDAALPVPAKAAEKAPDIKPAAVQEKPLVALEDFKKMELKVALIKEAADHPNADKLYVLTVDAGDVTKQIVAGIKRGYTKEELVGKYIVIVNNLQPAVLRGVESQGMLLAASDGDVIAVLSPEKNVKPGSPVK